MQLAGQENGEKWLYWPGYNVRACAGMPGEGMTREALRTTKPRPDIALALERLSRGFMFVGLTEEFDLSVCLFHAMFGGECLPVEFENMRPGNYQANYRRSRARPGHASWRARRREREYTRAKAALQNYSDPIDGRLHRAASSIFWDIVKKYNVGRSFCRKLCPEAIVCQPRDVCDHVFGTEVLHRSLHQRDETRYEYDWPGRYHLDEVYEDD